MTTKWSAIRAKLGATGPVDARAAEVAMDMWLDRLLAIEDAAWNVSFALSDTSGWGRENLPIDGALDRLHEDLREALGDKFAPRDRPVERVTAYNVARIARGDAEPATTAFVHNLDGDHSECPVCHAAPWSTWEPFPASRANDRLRNRIAELEAAITEVLRRANVAGNVSVETLRAVLGGHSSEEELRVVNPVDVGSNPTGHPTNLYGWHDDGDSCIGPGCLNPAHDLVHLRFGQEVILDCGPEWGGDTTLYVGFVERTESLSTNGQFVSSGSSREYLLQDGMDAGWGDAAARYRDAATSPAAPTPADTAGGPSGRR